MKYRPRIFKTGNNIRHNLDDTMRGGGINMKRLFLLLSCLLCLGGCSNKIEISAFGIVSGLGIDQTETGYRLSAQVINPSSVTGNHQGTLPVYVLEAEGVSIYDAYRQLNTMTAKTLYLPHLSVIIIDEAVAKTGIQEILDFTLRNVKIRPQYFITCCQWFIS